MLLLDYLSSIIPISKALNAELNTLISTQHIPKNKVILEINKRCAHLYFIEKGVMRGYYFDEDKEITNWFALENEFATNFYSFISDKPSNESIQAIEDCTVSSISYTALQSLYTKFPETERIGRIITENYYIKLEERINNLQFKTAKERYQKLITSKPSLIQRASLGQIASYIGITQETLSRIRAEV